MARKPKAQAPTAPTTEQLAETIQKIIEHMPAVRQKFLEWLKGRPDLLGDNELISSPFLAKMKEWQVELASGYAQMLEFTRTGNHLLVEAVTKMAAMLASQQIGPKSRTVRKEARNAIIANYRADGYGDDKIYQLLVDFHTPLVLKEGLSKKTREGVLARRIQPSEKELMPQKNVFDLFEPPVK
jgi:hypothetical protein